MTDSTSVIYAADLFPTFCKLAGIKQPMPDEIDGIDKSSVLFGKPSTQKRTIFWEYGRNNSSFRFPPGRDKSPNLALREGEWKLLVNADGSGTELYALDTDPYENNNVADSHPELSRKLTDKAIKWYSSLPRLPQ